MPQQKMVTMKDRKIVQNRNDFHKLSIFKEAKSIKKYAIKFNHTITET